MGNYQASCTKTGLQHFLLLLLSLFLVFSTCPVKASILQGAVTQEKTGHPGTQATLQVLAEGSQCAVSELAGQPGYTQPGSPQVKLIPVLAFSAVFLCLFSDSGQQITPLRSSDTSRLSDKLPLYLQTRRLII